MWVDFISRLVMEGRAVVDRKGRTFTWDEADGHGWFIELSRGLTGSRLRDQIAKLKNFEMREDDVLICAIPKAGTHWVWELASMVKRGEAEYEKNFKVVATLEFRSLGVLNSLPSPRVYNTHLYPSSLPGDVLKKKVKIIHVMRHPKDIAVSSFYHYKQLNVVFHDNKPYESFSEFLPYLTGEYGVYISVSIFRYLEEMESFMKEHPDIVLNLYFEEIKQDPVETVRKLAKFLEADLTQDVVRQIAEKCSFVSLKETESSGIKQYIPEVFSHVGEREIAKLQEQGGIVLFRKGEIGDWKTHFTVTESEYFDKLIKERLKDNMFIKHYYGQD